MPVLHTLLSSIAFQEPIIWGAPVSTAGEAAVLPITIVSLGVVGVVALSWIKARYNLQQQRLGLIRDLAEKGQLSPERLEGLLLPKSRWKSYLKPAVMVIAWFLLLGGGAMTTVAFAEDWPRRYSEMGAPGVTMMGLALATLSAPIMLRELRKQKIV